MFIAIEGGEGVGKSTQVALLKERLPDLFPGARFEFTHEPGGTPRADEIRARILSEEMKDKGGKGFFPLFREARLDHVENRVAPALAAGAHVVCDRYVGSTFAYQHCAMNDPITREEYDAHESELARLGASPDLVIILDAPVAVSQARLAARPGAPTHFDTRGAAFHERLREGYRAFAGRYPSRTRVIDATKTPEETHADIVAAIREAMV